MKKWKKRTCDCWLQVGKCFCEDEKQVRQMKLFETIKSDKKS